MIEKVKVCIIGGGNIAHSLVAMFTSFDDVVCLTRRPEAWQEHIRYAIGNSEEVYAPFKVFTSADPSVVSQAELVIVALPRFAIDDAMSKIEPFLKQGQTLAFNPAPAGLDDLKDKIFTRGIDVIGFQRVPYVARIREYGHSVWLGECRKVTKLAFSNPDLAAKWIPYFHSVFGGCFDQLSSFLSFTFSNSNPLLHPSRLVELLRGGEKGVYHRCPYFYSEWTDASSELYVAADREMFAAFCAYSEEAARADYESALDHYESDSPKAMTQKLRSIESLKPILAPWKQTGNLWSPDYSSRYFIEDIPYGTKIIQKYAKKAGIRTPTIDFLIDTISSNME